MSEKTLVAATWFGLCNRLKVLVSAWRLAELSGRTLRVEWPLSTSRAGAVDFALNTPFEALFDNRFEWIDRRAISALPGRKALVDGEPLDLSDDALTVVIRHTWRFVPARGEPFVDLDYGDAPATAAQRDALRPYLARLRPTDAVRDEVQAVARDLRIDPDTVGVHVRRADHREAIARSTDAAFFAALDPLVAAGRRLFLATDDPRTEATFRGRYGDALATRPGRVLDRRDPAAAVDALIDLLLLARAGRMVGSVESSFTELAWWLSGHPPIIIAGA